MMVMTEFRTKEKKRFLCSVILWQLKLLQEGERHRDDKTISIHAKTYYPLRLTHLKWKNIPREMKRDVSDSPCPMRAKYRRFMAVWRENRHKILTLVNSADHELIMYTLCITHMRMCLMSHNYHSMVSYHSAFTGVFIAAGVVGPCPVALWMLEPVTPRSADLCNRLCR